MPASSTAATPSRSGHRRRRRPRRDARLPHLDARHRSARHCPRRRPGRPVQRRRAELRVLLERARLRLRVPPRRRRLGSLHQPRDGRAPGRRQPHLRGSRGRRSRQRRLDARFLHLDGRHGGARLVLLGRPRRPDQRHDPDLRVSASEGGSTFECSLDGGAWNAVHQPGHDRRAGRRQPYLRRAGDRPRRPGDDPGVVHVGGRRRRPRSRSRSRAGS